MVVSRRGVISGLEVSSGRWIWLGRGALEEGQEVES